MAFRISKALREGGVFTFERDGDVLKISHRAIQPAVDLHLASDRAYRLARNIKDGLDGAASVGFQLPEGYGEGWSWQDWQALGAALVQTELLALIATGWEGVTDESGAEFPISADAIRTLLLRDSALYGAWSTYAARLTIEAAEGNVSALSPTGSSAGAQRTATDAPPADRRARAANAASTDDSARKSSTRRKAKPGASPGH